MICKKVDFNLKNFIPVFLWAIIILVLSASSGVKVPESLSDIVGTDKIGHMAIYAVLSILMLNALFKTRPQVPDKTNALLAVVMSSAYGLLMEIMQFSFFTGRYFEVLDIIANIIGFFLSPLQ